VAKEPDSKDTRKTGTRRKTGTAARKTAGEGATAGRRSQAAKTGGSSGAGSATRKSASSAGTQRSTSRTTKSAGTGSSRARKSGGSGDRLAVVAGVRTPFARQLTAFKGVNAIELGCMATNELLARTDIDPQLIERVVYGQVVTLPVAPNIAREIVIGCGMDSATDAYSVSRACATSFQSTVDIAQAIMLGDIEIGIAGGADSSSVIPIQVSPRLRDVLVEMTKAKTTGERLNLLKRLRPRDLMPNPPAVRDYSTRLGMGDIGEQMAKSHGITRQAQDELALRSHQRANQAWEEGKLNGEVMYAFAGAKQTPIHKDNNIRPDASLDSLSRLKPAFDKRHGTVTAGNSTPLTDGASSLLLMKESRARALGLEPLGFIRSYAFQAVNPFHDGLIGPLYATARVLDRAGLKSTDELTLIDIHEAFASQTLSVLKYWQDKQFAKDRLNRSRALGEVDWERINVLGGSVAYGHPFAATGGRMIVQTLNELRRRGGGTALNTACAAGGLAAAMVLEVA